MSVSSSPDSTEDVTQELEDIQLSPPPSPRHAAPDLPPEEPPEPDAPFPSTPPPFAFPTAAQARAYKADRSSIEVTLSDDAGAFESVALGDAADARGWAGDGREEREQRAEELQHEAEIQVQGEDASAGPTPPLSETDTSSKVTLPSTTEEISLEPPGGELPKSPTVERKKQHGPSKGASILQKTVSMTRQRDLPPKDKEQEKKHLQELEEMFAASKEAEKRRKTQAEAAAHARAAVLAAALPAWESSIRRNPVGLLKEEGPHAVALRRLWWDGTMPVMMRGQLWSMCIGNRLTLGKSAYASSLARAKQGQADRRYPEADFAALMQDVQVTLPLLRLFQSGGVMHEDLVDILLAYTVFQGGKPRYPPGISYLAAMFLLNMSPAEAFLALVNVVEKSFLKSFYANNLDEIDAYYRIFDTLLADTMPKVYANFSHEVVRPKLYLDPWLTTSFVAFLPLDLATRLLDVFLLEGDSFPFRVALSLLQILEPRLFNPVLDELAAVFRGEDRGAVRVVRRDKGLGEEDEVRVEDVYTEMGCGEEALFGGLERLEWKEETWDRLVARELPEAD